MDDLTRRRLKRELVAVERLFDLDPIDRAAALQAMESEDAAVAARVRGLLAYADQEREVPDSTDDSPGARVGLTIGGRFLLLRLLGSGGMGEVYLAQRTDDVDRKVALKLMRSDLPVPIERARRERHILARLDHPHIARFVDAGFADSGQPWFAMEFVDGECITGWCDLHTLDLRGRAALFAHVCRAVQFAHRNLVLHRDLKPSNILVDRDGVPKLLDFGVAKLLDAGNARHTQTLALTPAYAAPEQLRGEASTTASDVYQLGLVLYELLTGVGAREARASVSRSTRSDRLLPRLDHALTPLAAGDRRAAERIADVRGVSTDKLRRTLKGDLARIVGKATAEDAHDRYATAQAFADDLDNWVNGRPVAAHRGKFLYRAAKLVRRHVVASSLIALLALGLFAAIIVATDRAQRERLQRQHAETLLDFMNDVFRQADPQNSEGRNLAAAELLKRASDHLDQRPDVDAATRGMLKIQISDTFNSLALFQQALAPALEAVNLSAPARDENPNAYLDAVANALPILANLDRQDAALELIEQALPVASRSASDRAAMMPDLLQYRGLIRMEQGDPAASEEDFRSAVEGFDRAGAAGRDGLASASNFLAVLLSAQGNSLEALRWIDRAMASVPATAKNAKQNVAMYQTNRADSLITIGQYAEATRLVAHLSDWLPKLSGADAALNADRLLRLSARIHAARGELATAAQLIDQVLGHLGTYPVEYAQHSLFTHIAAARIFLDAGRAGDVMRELDAARKIVDAYPRGSFVRARIDWLRAESLLRDGHVDEAMQILQRTRDQAIVTIGERPSWVIGEIADALGRCEVAKGELANAIVEFEQAANEFAQATGRESPSTLRSELHALLAQAASSQREEVSAALETKRAAFVRALGSDAMLPVWQLDLMIDEVAGESRGTRADADRRATARAHVAAAGLTPPRFLTGGAINSFD